MFINAEVGRAVINNQAPASFHDNCRDPVCPLKVVGGVVKHLCFNYRNGRTARREMNVLTRDRNNATTVTIMVVQMDLYRERKREYTQRADTKLAQTKIHPKRYNELTLGIRNGSNVEVC